MVYYGASREFLELRFQANLADDDDTIDSVRRTIDLLLNSESYTGCDHQDGDQMPDTQVGDQSLVGLMTEQRMIASEIMDAVASKTNQLMFLQGAAGTGKTYTVKALISALQSRRRKCLICATTGIAAVQYPRGTTLHSLFHLGIDEQFTGRFQSNIGRGTPQAEYILSADLIIIDEVSMLTPWVAKRVSLTLQSISNEERTEFGGKQILFVGDLLQLPPVVSGDQMPPSDSC
jgi:tRNA(Met) C34 N-acetyltransferase TmcA